MERRSAFVLTLLALLVACADTPTAPGAVDPQYASGGAAKPSPAYLAITFADSRSIASDGKGTYTHGQCGVSASFSGTDVLADFVASAGKGRTACLGRTILVTLDAPVNAGDPVVSATTTSVHIKLQDLQLIGPGESGFIDGGFNQMVGTADCAAVRFNRNPAWGGADPLRVTRTSTKGVNGATRDEWLVESVEGANKAACVSSSGALLRHYHATTSFTVATIN
jgi:hypothetical protein